MNKIKLTINRVCFFFYSMLLVGIFAIVIITYKITNNILPVLCCILFAIFISFNMLLFIMLIRHKLTTFSDILCKTLDNMLSGDMEPPTIVEEENLFYKINYRLVQLYKTMRENRLAVIKERSELQELISDISHQVKMPIANLKMINSTLIDQKLPADKQKEFLLASINQLDKLDFLMQAMIKTSRLETGIISLNKKVQPIYDTLASALGGILMNTEKKQINVEVSCPEHLIVSHDKKWTSEALFNILDNAVKYTPIKGNILVNVESWGLYLKISISDTGKGIPEEHHGTIFKRFYREDDVHDIDGIGIGLFLAREIVTLQGGYIELTSKENIGSCFMIYLPYTM